MGLYRRGKTYWFSIQHDGERIHRSLETDNKRLAEKILAKVLVDIVEGRYFDTVKSKKIRFDELMDRFMDEYAVKLAESTRTRYRCARKHLDAAFSGITLAGIKSRTVDEYSLRRREEGASAATVNRELGVLSKAFNLAVKQWEWCSDNPCSRVQREQENNMIDRWLSEKEEESLMKTAADYLTGQLVEIIVLAINTGMRQGELLNLKWRDVDFSRKTITVTKTKNKEPKVIPMNQTALGMLRKKNGVVSISGYVFSTRNGRTISRWNLKREFNKALKKAGIDKFRFHDLRHTFATRLVQSGIDLYRVAKLLGHRDIYSTQRYAHHCPDSLRSSVEVLDKCNKSVTIDAAQRDGIKNSL